MFIVDKQRIDTMRKRLGEASELVDDDKYLPMFRHRQKQFAEEFEQSVKIAKTKKNASRYFATIWSNKNLAESLSMLRKMINRAKSLMIEQYHKAKQMAEEAKARREFNSAGRKKYLELRRGLDFGIKSQVLRT